MTVTSGSDQGAAQERGREPERPRRQANARAADRPAGSEQRRGSNPCRRFIEGPARRHRAAARVRRPAAGDPSRREVAIEEYRTVLAGDPNPETRHKLARLLAGDPTHVDEAVGEYRTLLNAEPEIPTGGTSTAAAAVGRSISERRCEGIPAPHRRAAGRSRGEAHARHAAHGEDPHSKERSPCTPTSSSSSPPTPRCVSSTPTCCRGPHRHADAIEQYRLLVKSDPQPETRYKLARMLARIASTSTRPSSSTTCC